MNTHIEQFKAGWLLTLVRSNPPAWMFVPPTIDQSNLGLDVLCTHVVDFKDARPLLKCAQQIKHSNDINEFGLPMVSIYVHKNLRIV